MKKKTIFLSMAIIVVAIAFSAVNFKSTKSDITLANLISVSTAMGENSTSNTGPKEGNQCGKSFCNAIEYICRCENTNPCTERLCNH